MYGSSSFSRLIAILDARLKLARSPAAKNSFALALADAELEDASEIHVNASTSFWLTLSAKSRVSVFLANLATKVRSAALMDRISLSE